MLFCQAHLLASWTNLTSSQDQHAGINQLDKSIQSKLACTSYLEVRHEVLPGEISMQVSTSQTNLSCQNQHAGITQKHTVSYQAKLACRYQLVRRINLVKISTQVSPRNRQCLTRQNYHAGITQLDGSIQAKLAHQFHPSAQDVGEQFSGMLHVHVGRQYYHFTVRSQPVLYSEQVKTRGKYPFLDICTDLSYQQERTPVLPRYGHTRQNQQRYNCQKQTVYYQLKLACLQCLILLDRCGNDPSAGSPTETLLRLHLPLNDKVWTSSHCQVPIKEPNINPESSPDHSIGRCDGRCVQRAGT